MVTGANMKTIHGFRARKRHRRFLCNRGCLSPSVAYHRRKNETDERQRPEVRNDRTKLETRNGPQNRPIRDFVFESRPRQRRMTIADVADGSRAAKVRHAQPQCVAFRFRESVFELPFVFDRRSVRTTPVFCVRFRFLFFFSIGSFYYRSDHATSVSVGIRAFANR